MVGTMFCLAAFSLGIDVGWEPSPSGGLEYIIQIEPELLDSLKAGQVIQSDIRPDLHGVRGYRIQVGTGPVPKKILPEPTAAATKTPPSDIKEKEVVKKDPTPPESKPAAAAPAELPKTTASKHIAETANYVEPETREDAKQSATEDAKTPTTDYFTEMTTFAGTSVGLLAALVYLGWIHLGMRSRYRALLAEQIPLENPQMGL